jgi:hypothetical protein
MQRQSLSNPEKLLVGTNGGDRPGEEALYVDDSPMLAYSSSRIIPDLN